MADQGAQRTFDVFFYGLYMDPAILRAKGANPREPRVAWVDDHEVVLGSKAMLLRAPGQRAAGMLYRLTHEEVAALYADTPGYVAEAFLATCAGAAGERVAAVSMVHREPPVGSAEDPAYAEPFRALVRRLLA